MNDCYLNFLVSFRALFSLDVGANLVNSKQTIGIILPDLSLLGYAVPVESFGIGLFVILFAYLIIEYNVQLLSHEKFKIAMNMLHTAHTPLILLRNQLEELKTGNLPEPLSQQVEEALGMNVKDFSSSDISATNLLKIENIRHKISGTHFYIYKYTNELRLVSETKPNGITVFYKYDFLGRLTENYIMEFKDGDYQKRILNIYDYNYYYGSKIESGEVAIEKGGQL